MISIMYTSVPSISVLNLMYRKLFNHYRSLQTQANSISKYWMTVRYVCPALLDIHLHMRIIII